MADVQQAFSAAGCANVTTFIASGKNGMYGFPNNGIEKELGVVSTARNWSTVTTRL